MDTHEYEEIDVRCPECFEPHLFRVPVGKDTYINEFCEECDCEFVVDPVGEQAYLPEELDD